MANISEFTAACMGGSPLDYWMGMESEDCKLSVTIEAHDTLTKIRLEIWNPLNLGGFVEGQRQIKDAIKLSGHYQ